MGLGLVNYDYSDDSDSSQSNSDVINEDEVIPSKESSNELKETKQSPQEEKPFILPSFDDLDQNSSSVIPIAVTKTSNDIKKTNSTKKTLAKSKVSLLPPQLSRPNVSTIDHESMNTHSTMLHVQKNN
ncbi:hypothetical protein WA158_004926 [Blastocystis sp. Blastoise]